MLANYSSDVGRVVEVGRERFPGKSADQAESIHVSLGS